MLTTAIVIVVFLVAFAEEEDCRNDVQRFVELTEQARLLLANGQASDEQEGNEIARFQARKKEARKALWESRRRRAA